MTQKKLFVDLEYCYGCQACEVACKQEHNVPVGIKRMNVVKVGPKMVGGKLEMDFVPMRCLHCTKAPCINACPEDVIVKRSDGIVLINDELCIGCMNCLEACPFGVIQMNPENGLAEKCNLCVDRVDSGLQPACVSVCPAKCIYFGDINEIMTAIQGKAAKRMAETVVL